VKTTPSRNEHRSSSAVGAAAATTRGAQHAPPVGDASVATPALSAIELRVLTALSEERHLSFAVLRTRVGATPDELRAALKDLRSQGLVARLHTLGESYASRFPGLSVDD
jgi:hypothetical protein